MVDHPNLLWTDIRGDIDDFDKFLTPAVTAFRAFAVVPKPDEMESAQVGVTPADVYGSIRFGRP